MIDQRPLLQRSLPLCHGCLSHSHSSLPARPPPPCRSLTATRAPAASQFSPGLHAKKQPKMGNQDKAPRWIVSRPALFILEQVFALEKFPTMLMRTRLATDLGVTPRQVQIWFQNRRQRERNLRKQGLLDDSPPSRRTRSTPRTPPILRSTRRRRRRSSRLPTATTRRRASFRPPTRSCRRSRRATVRPPRSPPAPRHAPPLPSLSPPRPPPRSPPPPPPSSPSLLPPARPPPPPPPPRRPAAVQRVGHLVQPRSRLGPLVAATARLAGGAVGRHVGDAPPAPPSTRGTPRRGRDGRLVVLLHVADAGAPLDADGAPRHAGDDDGGDHAPRPRRVPRALGAHGGARAGGAAAAAAGPPLSRARRSCR